MKRRRTPVRCPEAWAVAWALALVIAAEASEWRGAVSRCSPAASDQRWGGGWPMIRRTPLASLKEAKGAGRRDERGGRAKKGAGPAPSSVWENVFGRGQEVPKGRREGKGLQRWASVEKGKGKGDSGGMPWDGFLNKVVEEFRYRLSTAQTYRRSIQGRLNASLETIQRRYARGARDLRRDVESQLSRATALHDTYLEKLNAQQQRLAELTRSELRVRQQALNESLEHFKKQYDDTWEKVYTGTKRLGPLTKAELSAQQQRIDDAFSQLMSQYTNITTELRHLLDRTVRFSGDVLPRLSYEQDQVAGVAAKLKEEEAGIFPSLGKRGLREEKDRWEEAVAMLKAQQEKMLQQFLQQKGDLETNLRHFREQMLSFNRMYDDLIAKKESKLYIESMNDKILKRVLDCLDETEGDGWEFVTEAKGVRVHRKFLPSIDGRVSKYCCVKATGVIDASPRAITQLFEDNSRVAEYNKFYAEGRDLEDINENTKVVWASSPPMFFFKPRDFCTVVHYRRLQDGTVVVVNRGAEHPGAPRTEQFVRGEILMGANIIQPIPGSPNKCIFTMVTQVDPGGFAPPVIVNKLTSLGPVSFFKEIEAAAKRAAPKPGSAPVVNRAFTLAG